ncbi:hypothetical protein B5807_00416 [Epicoccum nigrum]|uniref:Uncharacterized protein n=1 Tax=Epicoccum nigrum TaxID=105696 RepID=A0A1Y2MD94_EPING|nr:hypothetical protein B5807_00416 [Epicoccum nigrum]
MSTAPNTSGPPSGQQGRGGPPYAPTHAGLGGTPDVIPDIPITVILLVIYLTFGIVHLKILKGNKGRGHKFIFNGALMGLCKIRVITMCLRIAWSLHKRNVGLAMAAQIFTYAGTIILYMINWFFTQRVVRAQHTKLGWSMPYRIFHRGSLALLVISLLMIIVTSIWQSFTLNTNSLRIFRNFQLAGQTYFTWLAFAPIIFVLISLVIPRHEIDKFGAGRLRVNITILLIGATVISIGQIFRCVTTWLPPSPLRNAQGQFQDPPWYFQKVCFYVFNFVTEVIVIGMYALVRVDLRFYVPDGAKRAGDYSRSSVNVHDSEKKPRRSVISTYSNGSNETLHSYQTSIFEDSGTLADSLRYPSSTLTIDEKTGAWKVKRASGSFVSSPRSSTGSQPSMWLDRTTMAENDIPPVPAIPNRTSWPLSTSSPYPNDSISKLEHRNPSSKRSSPSHQYELKNHVFNDQDMGDAVQSALNRLESNSDKKSKRRTRSPPPGYDDGAAANATGHSPTDNKYTHFSRPNSLDVKGEAVKEKRRRNTTHPMVVTKDGRKILRKTRQKSPSEDVSIRHVASSPTYPPEAHMPTHMMSGARDGPSSMPEPISALPSQPAAPSSQRSSSLEIITLTKRLSEPNSSPRVLDLSGRPKQESTPVSGCTSRSNSLHRDPREHAHSASVASPKSHHVLGIAQQAGPSSGAATPGLQAPGVVSRIGTVSSSIYSTSTTSSDRREAVRAEEEFRKFSYEAESEDEEKRGRSE